MYPVKLKSVQSAKTVGVKFALSSTEVQLREKIIN